MKTTTRIAAAAAAVASVVALGACSAELKDGKLTVTPDEGTVEIKPSDGADNKPESKPESNPPNGSADQPSEESGDSGESNESSESGGFGKDGTEAPSESGDTDDAATDELLSEIRSGVAGLTIVALPESGEVKQEGAYDCGGREVNVPNTVDALLLTGECPDVNLGGDGTKLFLDSSMPSHLTVDADKTEVLMNVGSNVVVLGSNNALAFAEAEAVHVPGNMNQIAFDSADTVTIPEAGSENELVFIEAGAISVDGDGNAVGYQSGGRPADNGSGNQFVSGDKVGAAVSELLDEVQESFLHYAEILREAG